MEPFFTFQARIPPPMLRELSLHQIAEHLLWWAQTHQPQDPHAALMAQHPANRRRPGG